MNVNRHWTLMNFKVSLCECIGPIGGMALALNPSPFPCEAYIREPTLSIGGPTKAKQCGMEMHRQTLLDPESGSTSN
jgi:hypothetical protein